MAIVLLDGAHHGALIVSECLLGVTVVMPILHGVIDMALTECMDMVLTISQTDGPRIMELSLFLLTEPLMIQDSERREHTGQELVADLRVFITMVL